MKAKLYVVPAYFSAIEKTAELVSEKNGENFPEQIIFTEEKNTLLAESAFARKSGGSFNTDVTSFAKYLAKNDRNADILNKDGAVMLIRKILSENKSRLCCFQRTGGAALAPVLYELITQLKSAKVTPEELGDGIENCKGILRDKLKDVRYVYTEYEKTIEGRFLDQNNRLARLPEIIRNDRRIKNADVYLSAYTSWTRQAKDAVCALLETARSVTAVLVDGDNRNLYTGETPKAFLSLCVRCGAETETAACGGGLTAEAEFFAKRVYSPAAYGAEKFDTEKVYVYEASEIRDEAEFVAKIIKREIINGGARYRDFTVAVGDSEEYGSALKDVFTQYEIPFVFDASKKLRENVLAKLIISAIDAVKSGCEKESVLAFVKNPLVCQDKVLADEFDNYLNLINLGRGRLHSPFTFKSGDFLRLEAFRKETSALLVLPDCAKVKEYVRLLRKLLNATDTEKKLRKLSDFLAQSGERAEADYNLRAAECVTDVFEQTEMLMGECTVDLRELKNIFASGFDSAEISIIPPLCDAVFAGDYKQAGLTKNRFLFLTGLNENVPSAKSDVALLNDRDLSALGDLKIVIEPKIKTVNMRERQYVGAAALAFSEKLYMTYSVSGAKNGAHRKSIIIKNATELFTRKGGKLAAVNSQMLKAAYSADENLKNLFESLSYLTKPQGDGEFARAVGGFRDGSVGNLTAASSYYAADKTITGGERLKLIAENANADRKYFLDGVSVRLPNDEISPTRLEAYYDCPYRCFAEKELRLEEKKNGVYSPLDVGDFLHETLEKYASLINGINGREESDRAVAEITDGLLKDEKYGVFGFSESGGYALERLIREAKEECYEVYCQIKDSKFEIFATELKFGEKDSPFKLELKTKNGKVGVKGKVDRVDRFGDYIRIIDYKSGKAESGRANLYYGKKIQLYLYMKALSDGRYKTAGVYYYPLKDDYTDGEGKDGKAQLDGATLYDREVILGSDLKLNADNLKSGVIPAKIKIKNGETEISRTKNTITAEYFDDCLKYAELIAKKGAENITDGMIAASPCKNTCGYCKAAAMCGFENNVNGAERETTGFEDRMITEALEDENEN